MTNNTENKEAVASVPEAESPAQQTADLTVQDLNMLRSIIDIAAQRGAFKPTEMAAVGTTYNKLNTFLESVNKGQPQNG
jgi:hypothetical protein